MLLSRGAFAEGFICAHDGSLSQESPASGAQPRMSVLKEECGAEHEQPEHEQPEHEQRSLRGLQASRATVMQGLLERKSIEMKPEAQGCRLGTGGRTRACSRSRGCCPRSPASALPLASLSWFTQW